MEDLQNSALKFFSDQELCNADIVPPAQVRARIEVSVLNFLKILNASSPAISDLPLIQRKYSNSRVNHGLLTELSRVFLTNSISTRSLMRPNAAKAFVRGDGDVLSDIASGKAGHAEGALLQVALRYSLGIMASSRGLIAGRLTLQEPGKEVVDCSLCGSSGFAISGDLNLLERLVLHADARYIIIVEKRLTEDRFFHQIPSILITAKGYPDMATRFLLYRINRAFPDLPILALVDWNPAGLAILCTFKFGSVGMGLEAYRYGLRSNDLPLVPDQSFVPLKPKDLQIARSLMSSGILQDNYKDEVAVMIQRGRRAEIEALYFHGYDYLGKYIAKKIVQSDYV
ncbi:hypothetical protein V8G54_016095 [Vigna mungo]|uniref:Topoisomerase 6 subunit A/Spo11 TOPRIM domain-containing protein n=1 Tax=Vigna mungo TaxID=3915 RepID=A0AAQ3NJM2_VIGMU